LKVCPSVGFHESVRKHGAQAVMARWNGQHSNLPIALQGRNALPTVEFI
jgi:hypothetical protein